MMTMIKNIVMHYLYLQGICAHITTDVCPCGLIRVIAKHKVYDKVAGFCYDLFERSKATVDGTRMNAHRRIRLYRYSWLMKGLAYD